MAILDRILRRPPEVIARRALGRLRRGDESAFDRFEPLIAKRRVIALNLAAKALVKSEHYPMAREALRRALALEQTSPPAGDLLCQIARKTEEYEDAIYWCRRSLGQEPSRLHTRADLAELLVLNGQAKEALGVLAEYAHEEQPLLDLRRGQALLALGRNADAVGCLEVAMNAYSTSDPATDSEAERALLKRLSEQASRLYAEAVSAQ